ncbi:type I CRISPR-associated protein Cas7 [Photobacterium aquimaris]|uniref:type I CRISPR-associated protein Cas7 n=1 Tax=Photobacterium aquimaris TaxID=512643 RepID=UPI000AB0974F|nr:type I CRISPR-associated protein Cas7 [Photobacterium aquimaris]
MSLSHKIDFAIIFSVNHANPNGDPLNGNRPRQDYQGFGEVTDVCLKRKLRDRLQEAEQTIFVQSDEKKTDGMPSLRTRAESAEFGVGKDVFNTKKTTMLTRLKPSVPSGLMFVHLDKFSLTQNQPEVKVFHYLFVAL